MIPIRASFRLPRPWHFVAMTLLLTQFGATYTVDRDAPRSPTTLATISAAAKIVRPGDRVVIAPGIYRESVPLQTDGTADAPITFEARQIGTVVVTGADPLGGLQRLPGLEPIFAVPWHHVFAINHVDGKPVEHHPDDAPLWGRAEQVIVDGRQLMPVKDVAALRAFARTHRGKKIETPIRHLGPDFAGAFAIDSANHRLLLWLLDESDPATHVVEASTRDLLMGVNPFQNEEGVRHNILRGLIFRYAATFPQRPAVWLPGEGNVIEDCRVESMAGSAVAVSGILRRCVIVNNGHTGGCASGDNFVNESNLWQGNSWKPISRDWEAGGVKIADVSGGVFRDCVFRRNGGPGLWLDIDVRNVTIERCVFADNEGPGLFIEISRKINAKNNLALRNAVGSVGDANGRWAEAGITIAESRDCVIRNNTNVGNRDGIAIREQGPRPLKTVEGEIDFHNVNLTIEHNFCKDNRLHPIALWWDNPFFGPHPNAGANNPNQAGYDPKNQGWVIDHNVFAAGRPTFLYGVSWRPKSRSAKGLREWQQMSGFDLHSRIDPAGGDAGWVGAPKDPDRLLNDLPINRGGR